MAGHFRQLSNLGRTELRIGSSMFFCTYVLPDLMKEFQLLYPQVTLTLPGLPLMYHCIWLK